MGARHADDRIVSRVHAQGTEQLRFFTPHDIRRLGVSLCDSRKDADVTRLSRHRDGMLQDRCEPRRRVDISGFNPPLSRTGHAADDNGQPRRGADGFQMRLQHGREAKLACRRHALMAAPFREGVASPVDKPKPKTARTPIDRDVCSLFHSNPSQCHRRLGTSYHVDLPASYARFVIDLRSCNQHDPKSCGALLFSAVWLRQCTHVRKNAA